MRYRTILALFAVLTGIALQPLWAQSAGLRIELNKLESLENACRAYLVFVNETDVAYQSLKLDLVLFDGNGVIERRLAVEGGGLPPGKTSVKLFDIKGTTCDSVARVLLNDILTCVDSQGEREDCIGEILPTSKASADFFK